MRADVPAKPAVVVGLERAQASKQRNKRPSAAPPPSSCRRRRVRPVAPPVPRARNESRPPPRRAVPAPFTDEATRQVDEDLLSALRGQPQAAPRQKAPTFLPVKAVPPPSKVQFDEPTRMAKIDPRAFDETGVSFDDQKFLSNAPETDPDGEIDDHDEATRMASLDGMAAMERARQVPQPSGDERTRAVNIRNDKSISDIDWDLD